MQTLLRSSAYLIAAVIGITGCIGVLHAWRLLPFTGSVQTTESAYVGGRELAPEIPVVVDTQGQLVPKEVASTGTLHSARLTKNSTVAITTRNLDAAVAWYRDQ